MDDDFIKDRDGGRDFAGRAAAQTLRGDGQWLFKTRFGAVARNKGGHLVVTKKPDVAVVDVYDIYGTELSGIVLRAGRNARDPFDPVTVVTPPGTFQGRSLIQTGYGKLALPGTFSNAVVNVPDEFNTANISGGNGNTNYDFNWFISADNGKNWTERGHVTTTASYVGSGGGLSDYIGATMFFNSGSYHDNVGEMLILYDSMDGLVHCCRATIDNGQTLTSVVAYKEPGKLFSTIACQRIGPKHFLAQLCYCHPVPKAYDDGLYNPLTTTGPTFYICSVDGGRTWAKVTNDAMIADENATFTHTLVTPSDTRWYAYQTANFYGRADIAPINATQSVVYMMLPFWHDNGFSHAEDLVGGVVKWGIFDMTTKALASSETLLGSKDDAYANIKHVQDCLRYFERGVQSAPDGGAFLGTNDSYAAADWYNRLFNIHHISTKGVRTFIGLSPFKAMWLGKWISIDRATAAMPLYDGGKYALWQSANFGATWTIRATISATAAAPIVPFSPWYGQTAYMSNGYAVMTHALRNDRVPNATAYAPWYSDDRVKAPV